MKHLDNQTIAAIAQSKSLPHAVKFLHHPAVDREKLLEAIYTHSFSINHSSSPQSLKDKWLFSVANKVAANPHFDNYHVYTMANHPSHFQLANSLLNTFRMTRSDVSEIAETHNKHPEFHKMMKTIRSRYKTNGDYAGESKNLNTEFPEGDRVDHEQDALRKNYYYKKPERFK